MELLLTGRTVPADEALAIGIASEVVPDAAFRQRLGELATALAQGPTLAYAGMRRSVGFAASRPLTEALDYEAEQMRRTGASDDHAAAVQAFVTKQVPWFTGG